MTEYEIIDAICDSVNPILFFTALGIAGANLFKRNFKSSASVFGMLVGGLFLVYGIKYLDSLFKIWESFGGDYSTHTAFAIAASIAISAGSSLGRWMAGIFVVYVIAMLYQQYHSVLDIVTTGIVIGAPLIAILKYCKNLQASKLAFMNSDVNYQ